MSDEVSEDRFRIDNAIEGLFRYGSSPFSPVFVEVIDKLDELNDNLSNMRHANIVKSNIDEIKVLLDSLITPTF